MQRTNMSIDPEEEEAQRDKEFDSFGGKVEKIEEASGAPVKRLGHIDRDKFIREFDQKRGEDSESRRE